MATTSSVSVAGPSGSSAVPSNAKQPTYEFTRRKRWAELLVNELSEAIAFVLSPSAKILFCTPSVTELLGWRDQELIDGDLGDLINSELLAHIWGLAHMRFPPPY